MSNELGFSGINGKDLNGAITGHAGGTMIEGKGIDLYALLALKSALKLQVMGMKLSRGMSATKVGKRKYGLTGQAKTMLKAVEAELSRIHKESEDFHNEVLEKLNAGV
jgi:hypothetical protein